MDRRKYEFKRDRTVSRKLYGNGNRCERMYSDGEREHHGAECSNGERQCNRECNGMCEHRECECNRRRRSRSIHVCVEQRKHNIIHSYFVSGDLQCNSKRCERLYGDGGSNDNGSGGSNGKFKCNTE
jgi:hypothetical protein